MRFEKVCEDIRVFNAKHQGRNRWLRYVYFPGFRTILLIRLSRWCYTHSLGFLAYTITLFNEFSAGVWIGPQVEIGKGFFLGHARGLVINPNTKIGDYCTVVQQVGFGGAKVKIGNYVNVGAGAKVISSLDRPVEIGKFVIIGAGAVVTHDVPDFSVIAGIPARVLRRLTLDEIEKTWGKFVTNEELKCIAIYLSELSSNE